MYVLTRRFTSLPLENGCIELAGGVLTFSERCQGRYLVAKRGVYPSSKPVKAVEELYIAEGLPLRVDLVAGKAEESLRLFQNFVKAGLWRELAPSFYAAVSSYAARCHYCTAVVDVALKRPTALENVILKPSRGVEVSAEERRGVYHIEVVSIPGHSQRFKEVVVEIFHVADAIKAVKFGTVAEPPLTLYLSNQQPRRCEVYLATV
jgi:hypothetical protein